MAKEMYINGKKFYEKEMERLSDEKVNGKTLIFYKDRNYQTVYGFYFKNKQPNLPNETDLNTLKSFVGLDRYGTITNKNLIIYEIENTKEKVLNLLKLNLKQLSLGSVTKSNIIKLLNNMIKKYGWNYPNYAYGMEKKSSNNKYNIYYGFLPTTNGDEPYQFQQTMEELGFDTYFENKWDMPYFQEYKHKKNGIIVSLTEGDMYLKIPK